MIIFVCICTEGARKTFLCSLVEVLKKENGYSGVKNIIKKVHADSIIFLIRIGPLGKGSEKLQKFISLKLSNNGDCNCNDVL